MEMDREKLDELRYENENAYYGLDRDSVNQLINACEDLLDEIDRLKDETQ